MSGLITIDGCKVLNGPMPLPWQKFTFESMLDTEFDHDKIIKNIALRTISCSPKILNELFDLLSRQKMLESGL